MSLILAHSDIFLVGLYTVVAGVWGWISIGVYLGAPKRVPQDVSPSHPKPPPVTKQAISMLESLGFHRLGEAVVPMPYVNAQPYWILTNIGNTIQAEVVDDRVSLSTFFDDNVLVGTDYPSGEHQATPTYQCHTITTSIEDAVEHHRLQVEKFQTTYGAPHPILSMSDYVRWEVMGRENYGRMKLKRVFIGNVAGLVLFAYSAIVLIVAVVFWRLNLLFMLTDLTGDDILSTVKWLTFPAAMVHLVMAVWIANGSKRDSRKIR